MTGIKNNTEKNHDYLLYRFELIKGVLRFFLIFAIFWFFTFTFPSKSISGWMRYLPIALLITNLAYVLFLLFLKNSFLKNTLLLRLFHYISLVLCPVVFSLLIKFTGGENSVFVAFFYFYLVVIPLAQISFKTWETYLSELFIIVSYPFFLYLLSGINSPSKVFWQVAFEVIIAATIMIFYSIIKRENQMLAEYSEKLYILSIKDSLTELYNRRFFFEVFDKEIEKAKRSGQVLSIAIGDCDDFKTINDEFGHEEGDKALQFIAQTIQESVRSMDIVARLGGEEFIILFPNTSKKEACHVLERVKETVEKKSRITLRKPITISFGLASFPDDGKNVDEVVRRADRALYEAKRAGKNKISVCHGMVG